MTHGPLWLRALVRERIVRDSARAAAERLGLPTLPVSDAELRHLPSRLAGVLWGPPQSEIGSPFRRRLAWERAERDVVERLRDKDPYTVRVRTEDGEVLWELPQWNQIGALIDRSILGDEDPALVMIGEELG